MMSHMSSLRVTGQPLETDINEEKSREKIIEYYSISQIIIITALMG